MVAFACALTFASCGGSAALQKDGDPDGNSNREAVDGDGGGDNKTANATDWVLSNSPFDTDIKVRAVAYGAGKFVAGGDKGGLVYSENGITWQTAQWNNSHNMLGTSIVHSITYVKDRFILGAYGKMAYSEDGVTWKSAMYTAELAPSAITGVTYFESLDRFVAVGGFIAISPSKNWQWQEVTQGIIDNLFGSFSGIAYGGGKLVAVGTNGIIAHATKIDSWTKATKVFGSDVHGVVYGQGKFVATSNNGKIAYSTNAADWYLVDTAVFGDAHNSINSITYGGGKYVAVGEKGKMAVSADAKEWQAVGNDQMGTSVLLENDIYDVAYGNGKFVVVGDRGKIAVSTN